MVISDLEYVAQNLPLNYTSSKIYKTNDVGRATKGSALALLCKLYMREKNWQKVVEISQQIIDLKQYQLYPSYSGLFAESNKWCSENIFSALSNNLGGCDRNGEPFRADQPHRGDRPLAVLRYSVEVLEYLCQKRRTP